MQLPIAAVFRVSPRYFVVKICHERKTAAQQVDHILRTQIAAHQQVKTCQATHRAPINDSIAPFPIIAQESSHQVFDGVRCGRRHHRFSVGALEADIERRNYFYAHTIFARNVYAALQARMIYRKAGYLLHLFFTIFGSTRRRCRAIFVQKYNLKYKQKSAIVCFSSPLVVSLQPIPHNKNHVIVDIIFIVLGMVAVVWGADRFTDGASSIATRLNVPQIIIGLTVVAFGTSLPEFCVSFVSALKGTPGLAVGNVVGSNIFNSLLIVGATAAISPMLMRPSLVKRDMPMLFGISLIFLLLVWDGFLSRIDSLLLLLIFVAYMGQAIRQAKVGEAEDNASPRYGRWGSWFFVIVGLACLIVGSNIFVSGASGVAHRLHVSEAVIGLTVVAGGTSLPELATSIIAARKGQTDIALGNVIGSNLFNILFILGATGAVSPMYLGGVTMIDFAVLIGSTVLLWCFSATKFRLDRWEGVTLLIVFVGYMSWLIYSA